MIDPVGTAAPAVAEVDPAQAIRDMKARITALPTDEASCRVLLIAVLDLAAEQFRLMEESAAIANQVYPHTVAHATHIALDTEIQFQRWLLREGHPDRRGGNLR